MKITRREILPLFGVAGLAAITAKAGLGPVTPARAEDFSTLMEPGPMGERIIGDENAPVTIIEYSSMTCPHCASFHKNTLPGIIEKYIETGKAKIYFREFPTDPRAAAAFMLARCAPQGKYFELIDLLYDQQKVWAPSQNVVAELFKISKLAGFTQESFDSCLKNQQLLDNVQIVQNKASKDYGVSSTPTFFINGTKYVGNMPVNQMSAIIDKLL